MSMLPRSRFPGSRVTPAWRGRVGERATATPRPGCGGAAMAGESPGPAPRPYPGGRVTAIIARLRDGGRTRLVAAWKTGRMSEQELLLTKAGFCWDPAAQAWNTRYQDAAAWNQAHGTLNGLPRKYPVRRWLYRLRKLHDKGRLAEDRARLLCELGALTTPGPEDRGDAQ